MNCKPKRNYSWLQRVVMLTLCICSPSRSQAKDGSKDEILQKVCPGHKYIDSIRKICQDYCSDGYFTNRGSQVCEKCGGNCETCNEDKAMCTSCPPTLIYKDNDCVTIDKCRHSLVHLTNKSSIRLVNGSSSLEGRVEIKVDKTWGTICDDMWTKEDGDVVCRMLNMGHAIEVFSGSYFGRASKNTPIFLDDLRCDGTEATVDQCLHGGFGVHDCSHLEDASVKCSGPNFQRSCVNRCEPGYFNTSKMCLPCDSNCAACELTATTCTKCFPGQVLQGNRCVSNCSMGKYGDSKEGKCKECEDPSCLICDSKEMGSVCKLCLHNTFLTDGKCKSKCGQGEVFQSYSYVSVHRTGYEYETRDLNISKDAFVYFGDVEILTPRGNHHLCDEGWDIQDANVICRQQGFHSAFAATRGSQFYRMSSDDVTPGYALTAFNCKGDEDSILDCDHRVVEKERCRILDGAGVVCRLTGRQAEAQIGYQCLPSCKRGFFPQNGKCLFCSLECQTCSNRFDFCTSCKEPLFLSQGKCVAHCGIFEYGNNVTRKCLSCNLEKCGTCANGHRDDICLSCEDPKVLLNGRCVQQCIGGLFKKEGECVRQCGLGFYLASSKCLKCPENCYACNATKTSQVKCIVCSPPKVLNTDGTCSDSCRYPTFEQITTMPSEKIGLTTKLVGKGSSGLVYLKMGTQWVPLCNVEVHQSEKSVICRELNLKPPDERISSYSIMDTTGIKSFVHKVRCKGTETSISQCLQSAKTSSSCLGSVLRIECRGQPPRLCQNSCPKGYTQDVSNRKCLKCSSFCTVCHNTPYNCSSCRDDRVLHENSCLYSCPAGTVEDTKTRICKLCDPNCHTCDESNPKHCRSCKSPFYLKDRACTLNCSGHYKVSLSKHLETISGGPGHSDIQFYLKIKKGNRYGTVCTDESTRWNENDAAVLCRELHYGLPIVEAAYSFGNYISEPVWIKQGHCKGNESSILDCGWFEYRKGAYCSKERFYCIGPDLSRVCLPSCPRGFIVKPGGICQQCHPSCDHCQGSWMNCVQCSSGYFMTPSGQCELECPLGYFGNSKSICEKCDAGCLACSKSPSSCTGCKTSFVLESNKCVSKCKTGFPFVGTSSVSLRETNNIYMPLLKSLSSNSYLPVCAEKVTHSATARVICRSLGFQTIKEVGRTYHGDGYFMNHPCLSVTPLSCSGLERNLEECLGYSNISHSTGLNFTKVVCVGGNLLHQCMQPCPDGFTVVKGKCRSCSYACKTCSGSVESCTSCSTPYYLEGTSCVSHCKRGYFGDIASRSCQKCAASCAQCVNGNSGEYCTQCKDGFKLHNSKCVSHQPKNAILVRDVLSRLWKPPKVRLVDGRNGRSNEGILQVYHNGVWGNVCSSQKTFLYMFKRVACFELGFEGSIEFQTAGEVRDLKRSQVSLGKTWMDITMCQSLFAMTSLCMHSGWGVTSCSRSDDIYLRCMSGKLSSYDFNYYRDLNGRGCLEFAQNCQMGSTCMTISTSEGKVDSVCINCPVNTLPEGPHCRAVVNEEVVLQEDLKDQVANEGDFVHLKCVPKWNPLDPFKVDKYKSAISVLWAKDGKIIQKFNKEDANLPYYFIERMLKFTATQRTSGKYTCILKTTAGDVKSTMRLIVKGKPTISLAVPADHTRLGESTELICESRHRVKWSWFFKGKRIQGEEYDLAKPGHLKIKKVKQSDVGEYKCVAENTRGQAEALLEVKTIVTIQSITVPERVIVSEGGTATIDCKVKADGYVKVVWKMWGKELPLHPKYRVSQVDRGLLTVTAVTIAEQAIFTCIAISDSVIESRDVELLVKGSPLIYNPPQDVHAIRAAVVHFRCPAIGVPPLTFSWLRNNDAILQTDTHARILNDGSVLRLLYVHEDQSAVYTCRVSNGHGSDQRAAQLFVLEVDITQESITGKLRKDEKKGYMLPSFGDAIFQVVFGPILGVIVLVIAIWCVVRYIRRRRRMPLSEDDPSTSQTNGASGSFAVKYHIPGREMDIVEEEEEDAYDETLEVIRYDNDNGLERERLVTSREEMIL